MRECLWCEQPQLHTALHCGARRCREVHAYWWGQDPSNRPMVRNKSPQGDLLGLYQLAEFLSRMALPRTPRQREFAKRYRGSMVNAPARYRFRSART